MLRIRSPEVPWLLVCCRVFVIRGDLWVLIRYQMTRWCNLQTKVLLNVENTSSFIICDNLMAPNP